MSLPQDGYTVRWEVKVMEENQKRYKLFKLQEAFTSSEAGEVEVPVNRAARRLMAQFLQRGGKKRRCKRKRR
jgi:hypothetical protein